jgi:hypothetical protein
MTAQQPEHCEHEHPCKQYNENYYQDQGLSCICKKCQHDTRSRPHTPAPKSGCDGCRKETEHLECPAPGKCDQMKCTICCEGSDFPTLPDEIKKYEAAAASAATLAENKRVLDKLVQMIKDNDMDKSDSPYFIHTSTISGFIKALQQQEQHP